MELDKIRKRKKELLTAIADTKKKKKEIISIVQQLLSEFKSGRLGRSEYDSKLSMALGNRTAEQWLKYYDKYIAYYNHQIELCDGLVRKELVKKRSEKTIPVLKLLIAIVFIGVLISLAFIFFPAVSDFVRDIGEEPVGIKVSYLQKEISVDKLEEFKPEIIVKEGLVYEEETVQHTAVVGESVKWTTKVNLEKDSDININLPAGSEIKSVQDKGEEIDFKEAKKRDFLFFGGEGVEVRGRGSDILINYETSAPEISEENLGRGKIITVKNPGGIPYKNVLSYTDLDSELDLKKAENLKILWIQNINGILQKESVGFNSYDTNENGLIDHIEWIIPYLDSEAVFEVVIEITKAEYLDKEREFIEDVYEQVKSRDNIYSKVYHDEYVRVTFEKELSSERDITFYGRGYGNTIVEVYEAGESEKIAQFPIIGEDKRYSVFLTKLIDTNNKFDLRVKNLDEDPASFLEFDYIVDPSIYYLYNCQDLQNMINDLSADYVLMNDIDCSGIANFDPIGDCGADLICGTTDDVVFTGSLDGKGHFIRNLVIFSSSSAGLIANNKGEIRNLGIENANITSTHAGLGKGGTFATVNMAPGKIENCTASGSITGLTQLDVAGGLAGVSSGIIRNSHTNVSIRGFWVSGGLIGGDMSTSLLENSYSIGDLFGSGGYVGMVGRSFGGTIANCFTTKDAIIGVVTSPGTVINSYYVSDESVFYGSSHAVYHGSPEWDFNNIWGARSDDLPILRWQACIPDCTGKECGDDGCGGSCGLCSGEEPYCNPSGECVECIDDNQCDVEEECIENICEFALNVTDCMVLGNPNLVYNLTMDIINPDMDNIVSCINITAPNVSFDCKGFYISSSENKTGVYSDQFNTIIRNCNVSMGSTSGGDGIFLNQANFSNLYNNIFNDQHTGMRVYGTYFLKLISNTFSNNFDQGVKLVDSDFNIFKNINISNNGDDGIVFQSSSHNKILDSYFFNPVGSDVEAHTISLNNSLLNCSYDNLREFVTADSELIRKWYYRGYVNDTSKADGRDSKGDNHGQLRGGAYVINDSLELDGEAGSAVNVSNSQIIPEGGDFTISARFKMRMTGDQGIYGYYSGSTLNYWAYWLSIGGVNGDRLYMGIGNSTKARSVIIKSGINTDQWYQVMFVFNGTHMKGYINGDLEKIEDVQDDLTGIYPKATLGDLNEIIGAQYGIANRNFNGSIDNIKVWGRALSDEEVYEDYLYRSHVRNDDLISHWTFESIIGKANVTAFNRDGEYQFNLTTDSSGYTPRAEMIDYINTNGIRTYYSNYSIYADNITHFDFHEFNASFGNDMKDVFTLRVEEKCNPPVSGNWEINRTEICRDREINIDHGSVLIRVGDKLEFYNVSFKINLDNGSQYNFLIYEGGEFNAYDGSYFNSSGPYYYLDNYGKVNLNNVSGDSLNAIAVINGNNSETSYNNTYFHTVYVYGPVGNISVRDSYFEVIYLYAWSGADILVKDLDADLSNINNKILSLDKKFNLSFINSDVGITGFRGVGYGGIFNITASSIHWLYHYTFDNGKAYFQDSELDRFFLYNRYNHDCYVADINPPYKSINSLTNTISCLNNNDLEFINARMPADGFYGVYTIWQGSNTDIENSTVSDYVYTRDYANTSINNSNIYYVSHTGDFLSIFNSYANVTLMYGNFSYLENVSIEYLHSRYSSQNVLNNISAGYVRFLDNTNSTVINSDFGFWGEIPRTRFFNNAQVNFAKPGSHIANLEFFAGSYPVISGFVNITSLYSWSSGAILDRYFPFNVSNILGQVNGANITIKDGGEILNFGLTDISGIVVLNISADNSADPYKNYSVYANGSFSRNITILESTYPDGIKLFLEGGVCSGGMLGNGTEVSPCEITTCEELQSIDDLSYLGLHYKVMNDIDCSATINWNFGAGFNPLGSSGIPFSGTFDGNNKSIIDLVIARSAEIYVGLFADLTGEVKNIGLENVYIKADDRAGSLVGNNHGNVKNSHAKGIVDGRHIGESASYYVGGLVGFNEGGNINNSYFIGNVNGFTDIGGLLGYNQGGGVTYSHSIVNVSGVNNYIGGLIGYDMGNNISNSYSIGTISGADYVGGLVGFNKVSNISESYFIGNVDGNNKVGGLIGESNRYLKDSYAIAKVSGTGLHAGGLMGAANNDFIENSYFVGNVSGSDYVGGLMGSTSSVNVKNSYASARVYGTSSFKGGLFGGLVGNLTNCWWYDYPNDDTENCIGTGTGGCIEEADYANFFKVVDPKHDVYDSSPPFWDFVSIWDDFCDRIGYPPLKWQELTGDTSQCQGYGSMNRAPQIIFVSPIPDVIPVAGGIINVSFNFSVNDTNGYTSLNSSTARANFTFGDIIRENLTCAFVEGSGDNANYTCRIGMWYYDKPGAWNISVAIADLDGNWGLNDSTTFSYQAASYDLIIPGSINWSDVKIGGVNQLADNNLTVFDLGNMNVTQVGLIARHLNGTASGKEDEQILAEWFAFGDTDSCNGMDLSNNSRVNLTFFIGFEDSFGYSYANETLEFCLKDPVVGISPQNFKTPSGESWYIEVVFGLVAVAIRKKQKVRNKKKKKKVLTSGNILNIIEDKLKDEYGTNIKEILELIDKRTVIERKEDLKIPLSIFKANKIGAAELLCKYLKDKEDYKFSEIAKLINRDQRTVALNYNNGRRKKIKLIIDKDSLYAPIDIFSDRRLSILEAIVYYLKERGYKNFEIALILNKDPRNIWTLYSRAEKKLRK